MNREKFFILAAFAAVLAVVLAVPHLPWLSAETPYVAWTGRHVPAYRGFWLELHNNDPGCPYEQYVKEIIATGADTLCLSFSAYQEDASSTEVRVDPAKTPSKDRLATLIRLGQAKGMKIVLMPKVLLREPKSGEWRGMIRHPEWDAWWADYSAFIVEYADFAQRHGVDLFMVGTELVKLEKEQACWRKLIRMVRTRSRRVLDEQFRQRLRDRLGAPGAGTLADLGIADLAAYSYSQATQPASPALARERRLFGADHRPLQLSYSANWDHYKVPRWWDVLDVVGMTTYYNLNPDEDPQPTLEQLLEAWKPVRAEIAAWQRKIGKPIFFTEVGWASQDGCSVEPWNYYRSKTVDLEEQRLCMDSFLRTFGNEPWVQGVLIWKWRDHPGITDGRTDAGYAAYDKPVLKVIEAYFRYKPSQPATAPTGAPVD